MNTHRGKDFDPQDVLDFWFPETGHENDPETHRAFWVERMQGGMDGAIIARFSGVTIAAARGLLDHWAETPRGRLALLIVLDQFPRSLWRDTPAAYAQDIQAARLALEGIKNGDVDQLEAWEMAFFLIAVAHCEGPDHAARLRSVSVFVEKVVYKTPSQIAQAGPHHKAQYERVLDIIDTFGRHPHRNAILSRHSTPAEEAYIAEGDFPHTPKS